MTPLQAAQPSAFHGRDGKRRSEFGAVPPTNASRVDGNPAEDRTHYPETVRANPPVGGPTHQRQPTTQPLAQSCARAQARFPHRPD